MPEDPNFWTAMKVATTPVILAVGGTAVYLRSLYRDYRLLKKKAAERDEAEKRKAEEFNKTVEDAKDELRQIAKDSNEELERQVRIYERDRDEYKKKVDEQAHMIELLQKQVDQLMREKVALEAKLLAHDELQEKYRACSSECATYAAQVDQYKDRVNRLQNKEAEHLAVVDKLEQENKTLVATEARLNERLSAAEAKLQKYEPLEQAMTDKVIQKASEI